MMSSQEFIEKWQRSPLVQVGPQMLSGINIPEVSKQFLVEAGLPNYVPMGDGILSSDCLKEGLLPLEQLLEGTTLNEIRLDRYRVIGIDTTQFKNVYYDYLCIEEGTGLVVYVSPGNVEYGEEPFTITKVNSSVPQLAEAFLAYEDYMKESRNYLRLGHK